MQLLIEVDGDEQLNRVLTRFTDRIQDVTPAWDAIASVIAADEGEQFDSEGRFASGGWSPLSPGYAAGKQRHYPGKPILERTGVLRESLTRRPFGVERLSPQEMTIGTGVPYSKYHQRGTDRMPQRRPLEVTGERRNDLVKILQRYVVTGETP